MSNKLIITESQYNRLLELLNETPFDVMIDTSIQVGDKLIVTHKDGKNRFRVVKKIGSGIVLISEDKGQINRQYRYFMNYNSMSDSTLEFKIVDIKNEPQIAGNIYKWRTAHYEGVKNIEVVKANTNKMVDSLKRVEKGPEDQGPEGQGPEGQEPEEKPEQTFEHPYEHFTHEVLNNITRGKAIHLETKHGSASLCCSERFDGTKVIFEINFEEVVGKMKPAYEYDNFYLTLINSDNMVEDNKNTVWLNSDDSFNLKLTAVSAGTRSDFVIDGIVDFDLNHDCGEEDEPEKPETQGQEPDTEEPDTEEPEGEIPDRETLLGDESPRDIYDEILRDKQMQKAFFKQPGFWPKFTAFLRGGEPSRGVVAALQYMKKYSQKQLEEKVGRGLQGHGKDIEFNPIQTYEIPYHTSDGQEQEDFILAENDETNYVGKIFRGKYHNERAFFVRYKTRLVDSDAEQTPLILTIVIYGEESKDDDTKLCHLFINQEGINPKAKDNLGGYFDDYGNPETARITFFKSDGYFPPSDEPEKQEKPEQQAE